MSTTDAPQWPSLSNGPLTNGQYWVFYPSVSGEKRWYDPKINGNAKFRTLQGAIFGDCGARDLLAGLYKPRPELGRAGLVAIYFGGKAIVVEPGNQTWLFNHADFKSSDVGHDPLGEFHSRRSKALDNVLLGMKGHYPSA